MKTNQTGEAVTAPRAAALDLRRVRLKDLKPHDRNPRHHPEPGGKEWDALKRSLDIDYFDPIVINSGRKVKRLRNVIVSGHLRVKVMMVEGYTHADAVIVDYDDARHVQVMLRANNQTGEWDESALAQLLKDIPDVDLDLTGFDSKEIDRLLASMDGDGGAPEPQLDRADELRKKWGTERGQLWQIGEHRLLCGDSTIKADVERVMGGEKADMIFTDPPYGHSNQDGDLQSQIGKAIPSRKSKSKTAGNRPIANDGPEANEIVQKIFAIAADLLAPGGCCCCCCCGGGPDPQFARWSLWLDAAIPFKMCVVWDKGGLGMGWHYRRNWECILIAEKPGAACRWYGGNDVPNVIRDIGKIIPSADQHPTEKPVALPSLFIKLHSKPGEIVWEPFAGSGSTLCACEQLHRRGRGIEIDPGYCAITLKRLADMGLTPRLLAAAAGTETGEGQ